ncbi:MAG: 4Fe-4S dicluster domain-containing protein [Notoacmeibacter sp.]|nr:4Fe-4S dicluster domain-containing protein [Notoacmeibacter sp.]
MSCGTNRDCGCATSASPGVDAGRRAFLKSGAAFATVALTPTVTLMAFGAGDAAAQGAQERLNPAARWGLLIDVSKCGDGCNECVTACRKENGWEDTGHPATDAQWIRKVTLTDPKSGASRELPVMCQHCDEPPCVDVCPTGASFKRADGIVLVDKHRCIGCRYCMMACPYKARSFIHEALIDQKPHAPRGKGTVESCTLCVHRIDSGRNPACVESCNATGGGAMMFGDLNDPESAIAKRVAELASTQLRDDLGLDPGVHYVNL